MSKKYQSVGRHPFWKDPIPDIAAFSSDERWKDSRYELTLQGLSYLVARERSERASTLDVYSASTTG